MSLRKKSLDYIVGDILVKGFAFFSIIIVGKLATPESIGIYSLMMFVTDMFCIFSVFGMNSAVIKFYREDSADKVFSNILINFIILLGTSLLILYAGGFYLRNDPIYSFLWHNFLLITLICLAKSSHSILISHYISVGESKKVKWLGVVSSLINLGALFVFAFFDSSINEQGLAISRCLAFGVYVVLFIFLSFQFFDSKKYDKVLMRSIYAYSFPLLLSTLVGTFNIYFSRLVLSKSFSLAELGIYSYFIMIIINLNTVLGSFNSAWFPHLSDVYMKSGETELVSVINNFLKKAILLGVVITALSTLTYIISCFFEFNLRGYYQYRKLFFIMFDSITIGSLYILIANVVYIMKKTKYVFYDTLLTLFFNVVVTYALIKCLGLSGAALSVFGASILSFYVYFYFSNRALEFNKLLTNQNKIAVALFMVLLLVKNVFLYFVN